MIYVIICGEPVNHYSYLRTFIWTGNSGNPTVEIPLDKNIEDTTHPITKNSKTVCINDIFNLDCIPFKADDILEEISNEDMIE
jgi:hypothetical protein